jgi:hypothetical protein
VRERRARGRRGPEKWRRAAGKRHDNESVTGKGEVVFCVDLTVVLSQIGARYG